MSATRQEARGQVLQAVTVIYLTLPWVLFAWGWLRFPLAVACVLALGVVEVVALRRHGAGIAALALSRSRRPPASRCAMIWGGCAGLLIVIWMLFSGVGGCGYQNDDYRASNALLNDLMTRSWPLMSTVAGRPTPIVYYMGYYLPAALIGRMWGWSAANSFLWAWTLAGVALAFAWFVRISWIDVRARRNRILLVAAFFCLTGGLDYLGYFVLRGERLDLTQHLENWALYFQYSSHTTMLYWVPQHALAAWLLMGMAVDILWTGASPKYLGMALAAGILWSPFGVIGVVFYLPLLLVVSCLAPRRRKLLLQPVSLIFNAASLALGGIGLLYLKSNQFAFPTGLLWRIVQKPRSVIVHLLAFWGLEFGFLGGVILLLLVLGARKSEAATPPDGGWPWRSWLRRLEHEFQLRSGQVGLFVFTLAILTILPVYCMGISNDLVKRASIPALFLFWAFTAKVVSDASVQVRARLRGALRVARSGGVGRVSLGPAGDFAFRHELPCGCASARTRSNDGKRQCP